MSNEDQILMGNVQFSPTMTSDKHEWPDVIGVPQSRATLQDFKNLAASLKRDEEQQDALQNAPQAPCYPLYTEDGTTWPKEWKGRFLDKFDVPMSFRDFLRLKKEVLDAYKEYLGAMGNHRLSLAYWDLPQVPEPEWPEALKGLTREDIEILKQ